MRLVFGLGAWCVPLVVLNVVGVYMIFTGDAVYIAEELTTESILSAFQLVFARLKREHKLGYERLEVLTGLDARTIKSYAVEERMPPLKNILLLCYGLNAHRAGLGNEFMARLMRSYGLEGVGEQPSYQAALVDIAKAMVQGAPVKVEVL